MPAPKRALEADVDDDEHGSRTLKKARVEAIYRISSATRSKTAP